MILALAATEIEISPLRRSLEGGDARAVTFITGVGPVEAAVRLTRFLSRERGAVTAAVNFGVAGGYIPATGERGPGILDLYLAETEVFGDMGICYPDRIEPLPEDLTGKPCFSMDRGFLDRAVAICTGLGIEVKIGRFVTVAGISATTKRGAMLGGRLRGQCENMEGAAVARVCEDFALPLLELRCISNLVQDRDLARWRLQEACDKAAWAAAAIITNLTERT